MASQAIQPNQATKRPKKSKRGEQHGLRRANFINVTWLVNPEGLYIYPQHFQNTTVFASEREKLLPLKNYFLDPTIGCDLTPTPFCPFLEQSHTAYKKLKKNQQAIKLCEMESTAQDNYGTN